MRARVLLFVALTAGSFVTLMAQNADPGRQTFITRCAGCHGTDGNGGELGPNIAVRVHARTDEELAGVVRDGLPASGMPAFPAVAGRDQADLIRFLRTLRPRDSAAPARVRLDLNSGAGLEGLALNQSVTDLQLLGDDRKIHLLRKEGTRYRLVTSQADWLSYNGQANNGR